MAKTYLDTKDESLRTGIAEKTLQNWRVQGKGPPYIKLGEGRNALVRYDPEKSDEWYAAQAITSTSEAEAA